MIWQHAVLLAVACTGLSSSALAATPLESFARQAMSAGIPNRIPGALASLIDVAPDAPVHLLEVPREQASDGMNHLFQVMVELSSSTPRRPIKPIGVVLSTREVRDGRLDTYKYRTGLDGDLEKAILITGPVDKAGEAVKGSGTTTTLDATSPDVKKRFQHELDLWLKRRYLKKEWRSAEFFGGVLKKKDKAP